MKLVVSNRVKHQKIYLREVEKYAFQEMLMIKENSMLRISFEIKF